MGLTKMPVRTFLWVSWHRNAGDVLLPNDGQKIGGEISSPRDVLFAEI